MIRLRTSFLALTLAATACTSSDKSKNGSSDAGPGFHATVRVTSYGIPHILADDLPSATAALGYMGAKDFGCILLDQIVRVRSERARYFGPGDANANLNSDFGMLALGILDGGKRGLARQSDELKRGVEGYVAGFNYYLSKERLAAECDGAEWAKPLTTENLFAYYYWLAQLASGDPLINAVAGAAPPGASQTTMAVPPARFTDMAARNLGSNGWAIGKDKTATGRGMLLANPHFPWEGNRKFYESQITVPGDVNVYGASLLGAPVINIGFNEHVGWTHTVTTAHHFTLYKLTLAPGDPTSYMVDGQPRKMTSQAFTIQVKQPDGTLQDSTRTMYRSHYGPMVTISALAWSDTTAYTLRNANEDNFAIGEQWLRMDRAKSLDDLKKANEEVQGIPWVNTMAVDAAGTALYMDASRTPNLSDAALADLAQALATDPITQAVDSQGATLLDGSNSEFEWQDAGAPGKGIVPFSKSPTLERTDFVANANDSYWLTNPAAPLEGYSVLFGKERTQPSARTRMNFLMLTEATSDGVTGSDGKFTFDELSKVEFADRASQAEVLLDQVLSRCQGAGTVTVDGSAVDVGAACTVLGAWDRRLKLDSKGALLFREFLAAFSGSSLYDDAFDPAAPVDTPKTLVSKPATGDDPVLVSLGKAVTMLESAGLATDATVGDAQHTTKGTDQIPIHGGTNLEGAFNIVGYNADSGTLLESMPRGTVLSTPSGLTADGYLVNNGSSFMLVMEYTDAGPHAEAVLSYSESSDPASSHYADQTHLFSESKYRPVLFTEEDIAKDPELQTMELDIPGAGATDAGG